MDKYLQKHGVATMRWQKFTSDEIQRNLQRSVQEQEGWVWEMCKPGNPNYMPSRTVVEKKL